MIFIMGINTGRKDIAFHQTMVCSRCGRYSSYSVYMTYTVLTLFFIPIFKWNRRYFVTSGCCGAVYLLDPRVGRRIAGGEAVKITPEDLTPLYDVGNGRSIRDNASWKNDWKEEDEYQQENSWYISKKISDGQSGQNRDLHDIDAEDAENAENAKDADENHEGKRNHLRKCPVCGYSTDEQDFAYCPKCGTKL